MRLFSSSPIVWRRAVLCAVGFLFASGPGFTQDKTAKPEAAKAAAPKPAPPKDTITLVSGEQLIGKLVRETGGNLTFQSDALGTVTIPIAKVKLMHASPFAVVAKGEKIRPKTAKDEVAAGTVVIEDGKVMLTPDSTLGAGSQAAAAASVSEPVAAKAAPQAPAPVAKAEAQGITQTVPVKDVVTIIDTRSLTRELAGERSLLYGWTGSVTLGATLVNATNTSQTYTGAITAVRAIPVVPWTTPRSKTTVNVSETYGLAKDPEIDFGGTVVQLASVTKTDIKHGDAEYDRYLTPKFYWLGQASADHNFGNGLELQQAYGGGVGWTVLQKPNDTVNLKLSLEYLEQQFYNGIVGGLGTPDENVVALALTQSWNRNFAHNLKFTESTTLTPAFNFVQAYSGVVNASLAVPVYKKINVSLNSTDSYLGDPAEGYKRNSFQFTAGVTYVVK